MFPVAWTQRLAQELMPLWYWVNVIDRASEDLVWAANSSFGHSFLFSVVDIEWLKLLLSMTTRVTCQSREIHKKKEILNYAFSSLEWTCGGRLACRHQWKTLEKVEVFMWKRKKAQQFLKLSPAMTLWLSKSPPRYLPMGHKACVHQKTCRRMFRATYEPQTGNNPNVLLPGGWKSKLWHIHIIN